MYRYDRLNRLGDVMDGATGTPIEHYDYDATGNRLSLTKAGTTTAYTYPAGNHRLSQVGTVPRTYDATGNTTQIGGTAREFVYNDTGRMSEVKLVMCRAGLDPITVSETLLPRTTLGRIEPIQ